MTNAGLSAADEKSASAAKVGAVNATGAEEEMMTQKKVDGASCACCNHQQMSNSYSSTEYSVMVDDSDLTVTREEYRYMSEADDDDCAYCTTSHPNINLFLFLVAYVGFLVFGACMFTFIENPLQLQRREQLFRKQQAFLVQHPSVDVESLNSLLEFVTSMQSKGVHWEPLPVTHPVQGGGPLFRSPLSGDATLAKAARSAVGSPPASRPDAAINSQSLVLDSTSGATVPGSTTASSGGNSTNADTWEFTSSLLFVTSIVTTIGYGHVTPQTHVGKISTMLYSGVGIPLTLTFLSTMVAILVRGPARFLEKLLANFLLKMCRSASVFFIRLIHLITVTTILLGICFFLPAYAFYYFESGWTYLDALYYCYISLTTVGLGDFVPAMGSQATQSTYRLVTILYLYFGLTMIMLWLALVYRIPQFNLNKLLIAEDRKEATMTSMSYGSTNSTQKPPRTPTSSSRLEKTSMLCSNSLSKGVSQNSSLPPVKSYGTGENFIYSP